MDRRSALMGRDKVPHFDAKGESDARFTESGVPVTFPLTSFYWDNLIHFGMGPKPGPDGVLALTLPIGDAPLPGIAAEDIGRCAYGIFQRGDEFVGRTVGIAAEFLTGKQMAQALTHALHQRVPYHAVTPDEYRALDFPGAEDLGNMFQSSAISHSSSKPRAIRRCHANSIRACRHSRSGCPGTRDGSRSAASWRSPRSRGRACAAARVLWRDDEPERCPQ